MSRSPFPSFSNNLVKQNSGLIIYERVSKGTYYFGVEATDDCPYSVTVSEGQTNITKIEHGQFYDINLKEGQEKWFYLRNLANNTFKITSLQEYGTISIFANQSDITKETIESLKNGKVNKKQFSFKSTAGNTLTIYENSKNYCFNCYYLIGIQAN